MIGTEHGARSELGIPRNTSQKKSTKSCRRVFVVEDDPQQALRLEDLIADLGHRIIATATSVDAAFATLNDLRDGGIVPDVAVVDADLAGEAPQRIIVALDARGVPVVIASLPESPAYAMRECCSRVKKPLTHEGLRCAFAEIGKRPMLGGTRLAPFRSTSGTKRKKAT